VRGGAGGNGLGPPSAPNPFRSPGSLKPQPQTPSAWKRRQPLQETMWPSTTTQPVSSSRGRQYDLDQGLSSGSQNNAEQLNSRSVTDLSQRDSRMGFIRKVATVLQKRHFSPSFMI
jgi:hypothetical protein